MANFGFRHLHHLDILEDTDSYQFLGMLTHYRWWILSDGLPSPSWPWLPKITAAVHQKKMPTPYDGSSGAFTYKQIERWSDRRFSPLIKWSADQDNLPLSAPRHRSRPKGWRTLRRSILTSLRYPFLVDSIIVWGFKIGRIFCFKSNNNTVFNVRSKRILHIFAS